MSINTTIEELGKPGSAQFGMALLDALAECSETGPGVTRLPFTPQHKDALSLLGAAMESSGLTIKLDAAGTLRGRREADPDSPNKNRTLYIGSHQDSIIQGGRFDGIMGVVVGISVLQRLRSQKLPFAIELLVFADEEGVRFPTALMGPRALAGEFNTNCLKLQDKSGVALSEALTRFGLVANDIPKLALSKSRTIAYFEVHIEQGPVLEAENLPVGVVSGICGIERWKLVLQGRSDHAGTTPVALRKDALCAAAEMILFTEQYCFGNQNMVAVVGELDVKPNVVNAVPGEVSLSLEIRSPDDAIREAASKELIEQFECIANKRNMECQAGKNYSQQGVICDETLQTLLRQSIKKCQIPELTLMSGATHDASAMADLCPVAMLFVRCEGGISHHPDESILSNDYEVAVDVLFDTIMSLQSDYQT